MTTRLQDKRLWLGGGAALAILILLIAWFAVISPQRSSAAATRETTSETLQRNTVLEAQVAKLKSQNDQVVTLRGQLAAAVAALPSDSGLPALTRELSQHATESGVALTSVVVGTAAPAGAATSGATTATTTATTGTTPATTSATTTGVGAGTTTGTGAASTGLVSIPVTVISTGTGVAERAFLKTVQVTGPRRALVTSVQLIPIKGITVDGPSTMTLQLTVFSAPRNAAAQAALQKLLTGK